MEPLASFRREQIQDTRRVVLFGSEGVVSNGQKATRDQRKGLISDTAEMRGSPRNAFPTEGKKTKLIKKEKKNEIKKRKKKPKKKKTKKNKH